MVQGNLKRQNGLLNKIVLNHIFGTIFGSIFHFWKVFGSWGTFEGSPERRTSEPLRVYHLVIECAYHAFQDVI